MEPFNAYESIVSLEISHQNEFQILRTPDGHRDNNQSSLKRKNHRPSKSWNELKR
ncbi:hypothetical protein OIU74_023033, partial [Salix koriyanagi]